MSPLKRASPAEQQLGVVDQLPAKKARSADEDKQPAATSHPQDITAHPSSAARSPVAEWLESAGSPRRKHCCRRSDVLLQPQAGSGDCAESPSQPEDSEASSRSGSPFCSEKGSLVEKTAYRTQNLLQNHVYMCHELKDIPEHVAAIVGCILPRQQPADSSVITLEQATGVDRKLRDLCSDGATEADVANYFRDSVFPEPEHAGGLSRDERLPMTNKAVPGTEPRAPISTPVPDVMYGYDGAAAFSGQLSQMLEMDYDMNANGRGTSYPFLVVELKGDGDCGKGSLHVATSQCLGATATAVNIVEESLNRRLRESFGKEAQPVDSAVFSVAMSGTEARVFVTWKQDGRDFCTALVITFTLQRPQHCRELRECVRNIVDWGKGKRLDEIRASLDSLQERTRTNASEAARHRESPADDPGSVSSRIKRRKVDA